MKNINCADLDRLYYDISLVDEKEVIKNFEQYDSDVLINYKNKSGFTLLDAATMGHKTSIVRYLLSKNANPNMLNGRGGHAIITALMQTDSNNYEILSLYLSYGLSLNMIVNDKTMEQWIAFISDFKDDVKLIDVLEAFVHSSMAT